VILTTWKEQFCWRI